MKILHINNFANPGGSSIACYELAKELYRLGHKQQFMIQKNGSYLPKFNELGKARLYPELPNLDYIKEMVLHEISVFNPDVVHVWLPGHENPTFIYYLPSHIRKLCNILCNQTVGFNPEIFDKIIFISEFQKNLSPFIQRSNIIRYGLSLESKDHNVSNNIKIGRVSAFCPSKKIEDTIKCAAILPNNEFIIGGEVLDVKYWLYLQKLISDLKLDNVKMITNISEEDKLNILETVDIWHYPTSEEAFCISILEAMAYSKAIITYNDGALSELNHDNNLLLANSFNDLVEKTITLTGDRNEIKRLGQLNKIIYDDNYRSDQYAKNMLDEYITI